jgi:hypothetical protein
MSFLARIGRLGVIEPVSTGDQSGRMSAPTNPQAVQTTRGHKDRTGVIRALRDLCLGIVSERLGHLDS